MPSIWMYIFKGKNTNISATIDNYSNNCKYCKNHEIYHFSFEIINNNLLFHSVCYQNRSKICNKKDDNIHKRLDKRTLTLVECKYICCKTA